MIKLHFLILTLLISACGEIGFHDQKQLPMNRNITSACLEHAASNIEGLDEFTSHQYEGAQTPTYLFRKDNLRVLVTENFEPEHTLNISYSYMQSCPCPFMERRLDNNDAFLNEVTIVIKQSCQGL